MKKILIILIGVFVLFVIGINITPGHYQNSCCGHIEYSSRVTSVGCITFCDSRKFTELLLNNFLVSTSIFDLSK